MAIDRVLLAMQRNQRERGPSGREIGNVEIGNVLMQRAAGRDREELHPAADAERRDPAVERGSRQGEVEGVALGIEQLERGVGRLAVSGGIHVGAAHQHEAVEQVEIGRDGVVVGAGRRRECRQQQRQAAGAAHAARIVGIQGERLAVAELAPAALDVDVDADPRRGVWWERLRHERLLDVPNRGSIPYPAAGEAPGRSRMTEIAKLPSRVDDRAAFDALVGSATNYERLPAFHAGRVRFDLERMRAYVERMGHPERVPIVAHVTGTKGKGSVASLLARALSRLRGPAGLHTSPHLHRMEERVAVDGVAIAPPALLAATNAVLAAAHAPPPLSFPTYFELMTLIAFHEFAARGCRFAVHEVGMGGALDATNVVVPAVTCITNVALEHVAVLGATVAAIATEKAGIVKPGAAVITAAEGEALPPIVAAAQRSGVRLRRLGHDFAVTRCLPTRGGLEVDVATWRREYRGFRLALRGRHQAGNLALAVAMIEELATRGDLDCDPQAVVAALAGFSLPARLETVAQDPEVVVDGAHTAESIAAAVATLREEAPAARLVAVLGLARDKDAVRATRALAALDLVVTTGYGSERQTDPRELAAAVEAHGGRAIAAEDPQNALGIARNFAERRGLVLVVGSLYLAAAARAVLLGDAVEP
jgi:dihydrofolate synthase/folylpolyglutamate synthase